MDLALLFGRILLAAVFGFAGVAKLFNPADARKAITDFGVPARLARPLGLVLPAAELAVATLLLAPWAWWGAVGALTLLSAFIVAIAANLAKGRKPACHCFGQLHSKPIGWITVARNGALAICAGLIVWAGPAQTRAGAVNALAGVLHVHPFALAATAAVLTALAIETIFLWQLFRQHGRLLVRMDQLEQRLAAPGPPVSQGLPVGAVAPSFSLPTPLRTTVGLATLRQTGTPLLLIFLDPNCQPCAALLPDIAHWQQRYTESIRIAIISRDSAHANGGMAQHLDLADVLLQKDSEVSEAYRVPGTPAAVLILADGTIGHEVALGREAIHSLLTFAHDAAIAGIGSPARNLESEEGKRFYGTLTR